MYVQALSLTNLRMFESAQVEFLVPGRPAPADTLANVTVLLGNNAAGKTTLLRGIALAALSPVVMTSSGFVPFGQVRRTFKETAAEAEIRGNFVKTGDEPGPPEEELWVTLRSNPNSFTDRSSFGAQPQWSEAYWDEKRRDLLVVGYGAGRRVDPTGGTSWTSQYKERQLRFLRVASLFEDSVVLRALSTWLPAWENAGRRTQVLKLLNELAPDLRVRLTKDRTDIEYEIHGSVLPFAALSEGYRAFLGWIGDLLFHVSQNAPPGEKIAETAGLVLVDEVDLHLHPLWQQVVVRRLAEALPRLQFVFTTHSPLVIGGLHRGNVRVIETVEADGVSRGRVRPASEESFGRSADQILTSPAFGLGSTRPPDFVERLSDAAMRARRGDAEATERLLRMMSFGAEGDVERPRPGKPRRGPTAGS